MGVDASFTSRPIFPEGCETITYEKTGAKGNDVITFNFENPSSANYHYVCMSNGEQIWYTHIYANGKYIGDRKIHHCCCKFETTAENIEIKIKPIPYTRHVGWIENPSLQLCTFSHDFEYLTIIASPRIIPDSLYTSCYHDTRYQIRSAVDVWYARLNKLIEPMFGRIYGITTSDVSAYIARSIFYDELFDNIYGENSYTGMSMGCNYLDSNEDAKLIKDKTSASDYDCECFVCRSITGCHKVGDWTDPVNPEYTGKQFITYMGHGGPEEWYGVISSDYIPRLDLTYSWADACSTCNYWQGGSKTFGMLFLKKGGLAYYGSVGVGGIGSPSRAIKYFTTGSNRPLGGLKKFLLGDPTLVPVFKEVDWS